MAHGLRPTKAGTALADRPQTFTDADAMAHEIFERMNGVVRLALPLGLGKPVTLVNALTRAARADPALRLSIFTALTLQRPAPETDMEKRFLEPAMDRLFGAYPDLLYADLIKREKLPDNIEVSEFFFQAGAWLGNEYAQRHFISANYTHARDVLIAQRPNVLSQLVAVDGDRISLSCNTDISTDFFDMRRAGKLAFIAVAERNDALPFMDGPATLASVEFEMMLEPPDQFELFPPRAALCRIHSTPSGCMCRGWSGTVAPCRSALARLAMRWQMHFCNGTAQPLRISGDQPLSCLRAMETRPLKLAFMP
ncbi:hypothetical protein U5922_018190 [Aquicoccus sp. G2-2]|uniref:hypothetical protein n=1 Tax=Aquicoccus sp. G2-2 TaxID=3092120 RepID=UPI002ADFDA52|nr:hypothetical protein [Aquicoccus sp. G2-2]MEA1115303.1 hypothetical protein [Aquicoccus sp. G2-2]